MRTFEVKVLIEKQKVMADSYEFAGVAFIDVDNKKIVYKFTVQHHAKKTLLYVNHTSTQLFCVDLEKSVKYSAIEEKYKTLVLLLRRPLLMLSKQIQQNPTLWFTTRTTGIVERLAYAELMELFGVIEQRQTYSAQQQNTHAYL